MRVLLSLSLSAHFIAARRVAKSRAGIWRDGCKSSRFMIDGLQLEVQLLRNWLSHLQENDKSCEMRACRAVALG